jgi:hypothetical protein
VAYQLLSLPLIRPSSTEPSVHDYNIHDVLSIYPSYSIFYSGGAQQGYRRILAVLNDRYAYEAKPYYRKLSLIPVEAPNNFLSLLL